MLTFFVLSGHVAFAFEDDVNDAHAALTGAVTAFGHFRGDVHRSNVHGFGETCSDRAMTTAAQFRCVHRVPNGGTSCGQSDHTVTRFHGHDHGAHVEVNGLFAHEDLAFVHGHMTGVVGFNLPVQKRGTGVRAPGLEPGF